MVFFCMACGRSNDLERNYPQETDRCKYCKPTEQQWSREPIWELNPNDKRMLRAIKIAQE